MEPAPAPAPTTQVDLSDDCVRRFAEGFVRARTPSYEAYEILSEPKNNLSYATIYNILVQAYGWEEAFVLFDGLRLPDVFYQPESRNSSDCDIAYDPDFCDYIDLYDSQEQEEEEPSIDLTNDSFAVFSSAKKTVIDLTLD